MSVLLQGHPPQWLRFVGGCSTDEHLTWAGAADARMVHQ
jgi:hypothetical protein